MKGLGAQEAISIILGLVDVAGLIFSATRTPPDNVVTAFALIALVAFGSIFLLGLLCSRETDTIKQGTTLLDDTEVRSQHVFRKDNAGNRLTSAKIAKFEMNKKLQAQEVSNKYLARQQTALVIGIIFTLLAAVFLVF